MSRSHVALIEAASEALMVNGDVETIPEYFAPDYLAHLTDQDLTGGHAALRGVVALYRRAFADVHVDIEILVKAKDRIAWQRTLSGTHAGSFKGFPATGRPLVWRDMVTSRFHKGLIAEEWVVTDLAEQLLLARKR